MAGKRNRDPWIGLMLTAFDEILASVPTERNPGEHGPLTADQIKRAVEVMDDIAAEVAAERETGPHGPPNPNRNL